MKTKGFFGYLKYSEDVCAKQTAELLKVIFPDAIDVAKSNRQDDLNGVDYWVTLRNGKRLGVDIKNRTTDPSLYYKKIQDVALEIYSKVQGYVVGWTGDPSKITDYIVWYYIETKRWCVFPFKPMRSAFIRNGDHWAGIYKTAKQTTTYEPTEERWQSECVFVPNTVVWEAMQEFLDTTDDPNIPRTSGYAVNECPPK